MAFPDPRYSGHGDTDRGSYDTPSGNIGARTTTPH